MAQEKKSHSKGKGRAPSRDKRNAREQFDIAEWTPKTALGRAVKNGELTTIEQVLESGQKILEVEVVDALAELESDLIAIGQAKGKFGGGRRRPLRQTQKKTKEGNNISFTTAAIVGNGNGIVGLGFGKSKETIPARQKAIRKAKLNILTIRRGNGTWESQNKTPNTIPFTVSGKCGSVKVTLIPAPEGTGLCVETECQKLLRLAGIKDVWSKIEGKTSTKFNLIKACFEAIKQTATMRVLAQHNEKLSLIEGTAKKVQEELAVGEE